MTDFHELALDAMIDQMIAATQRAEQAIDDALAYVEASNQRIAAMESASGTILPRLQRFTEDKLP